MLNVTQFPMGNETTPIATPSSGMDSELFVVLITLCILALLFVVGIGANALLLVAFQRRPILQTVSNRYVISKSNTDIPRILRLLCELSRLNVLTVLPQKQLILILP